MPRLTCLFAILCALSLAGCASKSKILGTWEGTTDYQGISANIAQTFNPDGTFATHMSAKSPLGGDDMTLDASGTYKIEDETKLRVIATQFTLHGVPDLFKKDVLAPFEKEKNKEIVQTIQWTDDDTITATRDNKTINFKRKKS